MKNKGFTLIEIVITIVILGIIALFSFSFFGNLTQTYSMMGAKTKAHLEATYTLERITREIKDAKEVKINNNIIEFERAHATGQDTNKYIKFYLSGADLYRDSASDSGFTTNTTHNLIARNVSTFQVSPNGIPLPINTNITVTISVVSGGASQGYSVDVCPKNYADSASCSFTGRNYGGCYEERIY